MRGALMQAGLVYNVEWLVRVYFAIGLWRLTPLPYTYVPMVATFQLWSTGSGGLSIISCLLLSLVAASILGGFDTLLGRIQRHGGLPSRQVTQRMVIVAVALACLWPFNGRSHVVLTLAVVMSIFGVGVASTADDHARSLVRMILPVFVFLIFGDIWWMIRWGVVPTAFPLRIAPVGLWVADQSWLRRKPKPRGKLAVAPIHFLLSIVQYWLPEWGFQSILPVDPHGIWSLIYALLALHSLERLLSRRPSSIQKTQ